MLPEIISLVVFMVIAIKSARCQDYEYLVHRKDLSCEPSGLGLDNFEGIRIQHQVLLGAYPLHHLRLSTCKYGDHIGHDAYLPIRANASGDYVVMPWGAKICTSGPDYNAKCYWMARSKEFAFQSVPLTLPGQVIGALFECPGVYEDDDVACFQYSKPETIKPTHLVISDDPYHAWFEMANERHVVLRIPFAMAVAVHYTEFNSTFQGAYIDPLREERTMNILDDDSITPMENYTYSKEQIDRRDKADRTMLSSSPIWDVWFRSSEIEVPWNYNTYMGSTSDCECGGVLNKLLTQREKSLDDLKLEKFGSMGYESQCLNEFPDLYDKLMGKLQYKSKHVRAHLMPYRTRSLMTLHSYSYLRMRRFLHMVKDAYG